MAYLHLLHRKNAFKFVNAWVSYIDISNGKFHPGKLYFFKSQKDQFHETNYYQ